jgi:hypothetical protein
MPSEDDGTDIPDTTQVSEPTERLYDAVFLSDTSPDGAEETIRIDSLGIAHLAFRNWTYSITVGTARADSLIWHFYPQFLSHFPSNIRRSNCSDNRYHLRLYLSGELQRERHVLICREIESFLPPVAVVVAGFDSLQSIREAMKAEFIDRGCHQPGRTC